MAATPHRRGKLPSSDEDGGPGAEEAAERALLHKGAASSPALGALSGGGRGGASPLDVASAGRGGSGAGRRRALHWVIYVLALCAGLGLLVYSADRSDRSHKSFVKVKGTQFVLDCRPFFVTGFNLESAMLAPLPALARRLANGDKGGVHMVRGVMEAAAGAGMNVMRAFAHSPDPNFPLQTQPGQYDEAVFRGLDTVVAEAERAGLRVILSLVDNWKYHGGVDEFVDWSDSVPPRDKRYPPANKAGDVSVEEYSPERLAYENQRKVLFYTDDGCRRMFKDHVRAVLHRRNTVSGKLYKDDPAIMAFNLINEPRCSAYETPACTDALQKWVLDMSTHFKSLDQAHLLTVGSEGFWGERDSMRDNNPGAPASDWASKAGQDFILNNNLPMIDFAAVHLWPTNWNVAHNATFMSHWVDKHVEDCDTLLKKPCLLEEYGHALGTRGLAPPAEAIAAQRDPVYRAVLAAVEAAVGRGRGLAGSLFWRWGLAVYKNDVPGVYGVLPEHSTFQLVSEHAQRMRAHMNANPPAQECQADCWVAAESLYGTLRRCEHRPSACAENRARRQYSKTFDEGSGQLAPRGQQVYASQAECCRPGLGGFAEGCSTTLF